MPKGSRGGQRAANRTTTTTGSGSLNSFANQMNQAYQQLKAQPAPQPAQPTPTPAPTPQQVAQGNVMPAGGVAFSTFETMTDDQKAGIITSALRSGTPMFLDDSGLQKFAYFTGMNDKPQVLPEAQLKKMKGQDLWRSVRTTYNPSTDIGYTGTDIYNQMVKGDFTNFSDSGGSAYGKGLYFDISKGSYGSGGKYTVMHAKLAPGAKTISDVRLDSMFRAAYAKGDKLAVACAKADYASRASLYGLAKGYDAAVAGNGYHIVFNRRCLIFSDTTF